MRVDVAGLAALGACALAVAACGSSVAGDDELDAAPGDALAGDGAGAVDGPPPDALAPCTLEAPPPPAPSVRWPPELSATGAATLGGHGHDDGRGPVGVCGAPRVAGAPYFRLVAAGLEIDTDVDGSGGQGDAALAVDFWRRSPFVGLGESAGRVNVYVEIVDESGTVLSGDTAPALRIRREILDGPTDDFALTTKPPGEFQTNFPMIGGGQRYAFSIAGASDRVINLRLPVNHHVCYVLVFQREPAT